MGAVIEDHARKNGERTAIVGTQIGEVSYLALQRQISKSREEFRSAGLGGNSRIGLVLPSGTEAAVATIAAASHATCVPFHPAISQDELVRELKRFRLDAIILPEWQELPASQVAKDYPCALFSVAKAEGSFDRFDLRGARAMASRPVDCPEPVSRSEAIVIRTSATTGLPKLVPVTHESMIAQSNKMHRWLGLSAGDRGACVLPTYYSQGCTSGLLIPLLLGGSVAIPDSGRFDSQGNWIADLAPTWFSGGPTFLLGLLDALRSRGDARRHALRFVLSSSAHLPPQVREGVEAALGVPVLEFFGMSEGGMLTCNPPPPQQRKPGTAGRIVQGELVVRDEAGNIAPPGEVGEIFVSGPAITLGYIVDDGPARIGLRDGWLPTGDLGSIDADGFLTISGRLKDIINRGGEKISPIEIESAMLLHPAVREAAAFGVPHPRLGENVAMAVVLKPGAAATASDLRDFLRQRLSAFKMPQRIDVVDALPKGNTGKVLRNSLRDIAASQERAHTPPESALEIQIAEIWRRFLKTDQIGIDDDFFEAGGDSLLAEQMLLEVESVVNHEISVSALSEATTIRGLVAIAVSGDDADRELLTKVREAPGTPFFYCHGDYGSRGFYALKLARLFDPPQPVYLVHTPRNVKESDDLSIEAMASLCVPLLLAARPEGLFRLGGHCNGGLLAVEIANQLTRSGREVELIVLIETISINCRWPLRLANRAIRGLGATVRPLRRRLARGGMLSIWRILQVFASIHDYGLSRTIRRSMRRVRYSVANDPNGEMEFAYFRAMANYVPPKLDCPIVTIIAEKSILPFRSPASWRSRAPLVRHATVPGDHLGCITIEVAALARRVGSVLEDS
jgi:acyl-CoA synthetase (AMP-forming)/AMP-acid ligase II/thioesterase domain-containing protein/acyl carrier protein